MKRPTLNGEQVYEHSCTSTGLAPEAIWTTPFAFDAKAHLKYGEHNTLTVRVYNRKGMGGVYLPVYVIGADCELDAELMKAILGKSELDLMRRAANGPVADLQSTLVFSLTSEVGTVDRFFLLAMFGVCAVAMLATSSSTEGRPNFRPVPEGVVELLGFPADGGIVEREDGALMFIYGGGVYESGLDTPRCRLSTDAGQTWGEPTPVNCEIGAGGVIRLQSGALGMYGTKARERGAYYFCSSPDEGKTWTEPVLIPTYPDFYPMYHSLIQLKSGRLLLTGYWEALDGYSPDVWPHARNNWSLWKGNINFAEGHRGPENGIALVYRSDDEGQSWQQCNAGLFGWFDERGVPNGQGGITPVWEPTSAETEDGRVLLFARSKTGRVVYSYSLDGGATWQSILPTELASSQAPPLLIRIPKTGDLLCVWNQVSAEEIRRGFARGRLSAAISRDSGLTWENFKTLELQKGMADVARITPEFPIPRRIVGRPGVGQVPDGYAKFTYANVDIIGDQVFVRYHRQWPEVIQEKTEKVERSGGWPVRWPVPDDREARMTGEAVLRIYPLEWFYE